MPYKPTGKPAGRPKSMPVEQPPIVPAAPLVPPKQGSLEETVMLGDMASVHASSAAKLRWFHDRAEIQRTIATNDITKYKEIAEVSTKAIAELEARLKTATDDLAIAKSTHAIEIGVERRGREDAVKDAARLRERVEELTPLAKRWMASQIIDATGLDTLAKSEAQRRELYALRKEIRAFDIELERPNGGIIPTLPKEEREKRFARAEYLRRRIAELTESPAEKVIRLAEETKAARDDEEKNRQQRQMTEEDKEWKRGFSNLNRSRIQADLADIARLNRTHTGTSGILTVDK